MASMHWFVSTSRLPGRSRVAGILSALLLVGAMGAAQPLGQPQDLPVVPGHRYSRAGGGERAPGTRPAPEAIPPAATAEPVLPPESPSGLVDADQPTTFSYEDPTPTPTSALEDATRPASPSPESGDLLQTTPSLGASCVAGSAETSASSAMGPELVTTQIDAQAFLQVIAPMLTVNERACAADSRMVAVTAKPETRERIRAFARQLDQAQQQRWASLVLRVSLFEGENDRASSSGVAQQSMQALADLGVAAQDLSGLPVPSQLRRIADFALPLPKAGESRLALDERFRLGLEAYALPSAKYELSLALREASSQADEKGRLLFSDRFEMALAKPVVLGISGSSRTLILALVLKEKPVK